MAGPREQQPWLPWGRHREVPGKEGFHEKGQQAACRGCAELRPPILGTADSWDHTWEGEAERSFSAIDREGCVQPSVLAKRGVGAGGSFLPTGKEKQRHFSASGRKRVNFF